MKMTKKIKTISFISLGVASTLVAVSAASVLVVNNSNYSNITVGDKNLVDNIDLQPAEEVNHSKAPSDTKPLIPSASNYFNAKLSSVNGPILFWDGKITSADWFGAKRWTIDLDTVTFNNKKFNINTDGKGHNGWIRSWLNWDLDKKNNILYVLSTWARVGGRSNPPQQNVLAIDVTTGKIFHMYELIDIWTDAFFAISVLEDGNVLTYGHQQHASAKHVLINTKNKTWKKGEGNLGSVSKIPDGPEYNGSKNYLMNLFPIAPNRNFAVTYNLTNKSSTQGDAGSQGPETSRVEFILCDDNMNIVKTADPKWQVPIIATPAIKNTQNSAIWPQRDWYKLIDGRTITVIYDKLIVIDARNNNNPIVNSYVLDKDEWVESWSFDTNENLFYKVKNDSKIKKVTLPKGNNNPSISEYFDLKNASIKEIQDNANSFNLYNVYGYAGQIMLVNTWFWSWVNSNQYPDKDNSSPDKDKIDTFGLAAAITDNKSSSGNGDTKGLLNTEKAFQKSADFDIGENILDNKLPSEITRNDLTFTEKGFLTNNKKTENGQLKYPPFVKTKIDDKNKELEVEAHIDQIPWFVGDNKMPENIPPLKIKKSFKTKTELSTRYWWKEAKDDYDFINTLPSKLSEADIKRINPFVVNINSQKVKINNVNYPKLTYSTINPNDSSGEITIKAKYEYLPMDVTVDANNIKEISQEKKYEIFKSGTPKTFKFIGDTQEDINQINELKELKESNVLASSFKNADKQEFLKFIDVNNTKGYPLSKMEISITADDSKGELTIKVDPTQYDSSLKVETKKFIGFNKNSEYTLNFESPKNVFNKKQYRPSDVTEEIFFDNFVKYTGFDSTDLHLELFFDDDKGILNASLYLINDYPEATIKKTPFVKNSDGKWVAKTTIKGFKTTDEFNKDYQLIFKKDNDKSLTKIKESTPSEITKTFEKDQSGTFNGITYQDKFDFVNKVFVDSLGPKMPIIQKNKDIKIDLFANNSGGELTVKIVFEKVEGYGTSLTFIQIFTGFAKGNDVVTEDVLVLKNQMQLENTMEEVLKKYPSEIKKHLEINKKDITNFFTSAPTGSYKTAIEQNKFDLVVIADDIYGELIVTIKFKREDITNKNSLLEYSQLYTNLKKY